MVGEEFSNATEHSESSSISNFNETLSANSNINDRSDGSGSYNILAKKDPLIAVSKEITHFDLIPRVPLIKYSSLTASSGKTDSPLYSEESKAETLAKFTHFSK